MCASGHRPKRGSGIEGMVQLQEGEERVVLLSIYP